MQKDNDIVAWLNTIKVNIRTHKSLSRIRVTKEGKRHEPKLFQTVAGNTRFMGGEKRAHSGSSARHRRSGNQPGCCRQRPTCEVSLPKQILNQVFSCSRKLSRLHLQYEEALSVGLAKRATSHFLTLVLSHRSVYQLVGILSSLVSPLHVL